MDTKIAIFKGKGVRKKLHSIEMLRVFSKVKLPPGKVGKSQVTPVSNLKLRVVKKSQAKRIISMSLK